MEKVVIAHKFRLYPSREVEKKMFKTLNLCRQTYNILLNQLNCQKVIDKSQIQGVIPDIKICEPKFKKLYSKTMQYECYRLFSNLSSLAKSKSKRKVGRLRFKSRSRFKTFVYNQSGFKLVMT
ncbi:MAG: helix-turn-helix domain-containing protein, partial [Nanoarchaeota archaeon]|nr:helix-turn-helix domain-containing protein [Nanoarchaeota archaeon]